MGFNYLQTDDRDDYFASLKKNKPKKERFFTITKDGKIILDGASDYNIKIWMRKELHLTRKQIRFIWRKTLESLGYKIEIIKID